MIFVEALRNQLGSCAVMQSHTMIEVENLTKRFKCSLSKAFLLNLQTSTFLKKIMNVTHLEIILTHFL